MITKVQYVTAQVAALLDDPGRTFATDDYLVPYVQLTQDQLEQEALQNPNLGNMVTTVIIPAVPAGTFDLQDYFTPGQPLELLIDIISMKERTVGGLRQEQDWNFMSRVNDIPTIQPVAFNSYFAIRDNTVVLSGADQDMDLRIFGKFKPQPLASGNSVIVPNTSPILSFGAAALVSMARGNDTMANWYEKKRIDAQDGFMSNAIMEMQATRIRMRSYSGRGSIRV